MWAVPDPERWRRALRASHSATLRMEVWADGVQQSEGAPFSGGGVTDEWVSGTRRSMSTTIPANRAWLRWLKMSGLELRPYRGIRLNRSTVVECPLGRFPLRPPEMDRDATAIPIQVTDYFQRVTAAKFGGPTMTPGGRIVSTISRLLVEAGLPVPVDTTESDATSAPVLLDGNDRDKAVADLGKSISAEVYLDREGTPRIAPAAVLGSAVATLGRLGAVLRPDWERVYNVVEVRSSASDIDFGTVTAAITWPGHPAHPYRMGSTRYPEFRVYLYSSPLLQDAVQGAKAAATILARVSSEAHSAQFDDVPDPSLDAGDTIQGRTRDGMEVAQIMTIFTPLTVTEKQTVTTVSTRVDE